MAVWRRWRFWKPPGQKSRGEGYRYTNPRRGVKHRSPYPCPVPTRFSTISSRNHLRIPVSHHLFAYPFLRPFFSLPLCFFAFWRSSRKAHTRLMSPLPSTESLSACFSPPSTFMVIFFPFFRSPIYLSIRVSTFPYPSLSYLFVCRSIPDLSPSRVSLSPFFPIALHLVWLPVQTSPSRSMTLLLAPTLLPTQLDSIEAGLLYFVFFISRYSHRAISHTDATNPFTIFAADGTISCVIAASYRRGIFSRTANLESRLF